MMTMMIDYSIDIFIIFKVDSKKSTLIFTCCFFTLFTLHCLEELAISLKLNDKVNEDGSQSNINTKKKKNKHYKLIEEQI